MQTEPTHCAVCAQDRMYSMSKVCFMSESWPGPPGTTSTSRSGASAKDTVALISIPPWACTGPGRVQMRWVRASGMRASTSHGPMRSNGVWRG